MLLLFLSGLLPLSGLLASFANLRPSVDPNKTLVDFVQKAQNSGLNLNDLHGQPNKLINYANSIIKPTMDNLTNDGIIAGGNETGFGITADGIPVTIPRGSIKINGILY